MGYLSAEPVISPSNLLADKGKAKRWNWWTANTAARCEKAVARELTGRCGGFFLPTLEIVRTNRGRNSFCYQPLYPGYIFVVDTNDSLHHIYPISHIKQTARVSDKEALIERLFVVWKLMQSHRLLRLESAEAKGRLIQVQSKSLGDIRGKLVQDSWGVNWLAVCGVSWSGDVLIELKKGDRWVEL